MRFQVPQFIDVEDKIFGPMTFKQFIYIAGGIGMSFVILRIFPTFIAYILILCVAALSLALAFYKLNGRPFIMTLESAFNYAVRARLYLWRKIEKKHEVKEMAAPNYKKITLPNISQSKLKEMNWGLDARPPQNQETK